jgi:hypothetical protein
VPEPVYWNRDCSIALLKGVPILLVGFVVCATIVGLPIGIILVLYSGAPLARVQTKLIKQQVEEEIRIEREGLNQTL